MKRFIISLDKTTNSQEKEFIEYIKENRYGWWHWLSHTWLIVDSRDYLNAAKLRDKLDEIFPSVYNLVIELRSKDDTWSGFGPTSEEKNMFNWLEKNW
jgi:hypothetical protein